MDDDDCRWMRLALAEAARGCGAVEPNPMVGAVVVRENRLVGLGHHARFGASHAEVNALSASGESARGATLYVTLEPCCHFGKTPPCTDAILAAGVTRVVVAIRDPFPRVNGGGLAILRAAGLSVEVGCEAQAAQKLCAPYLKKVTTGLPFVTAKWAMTLDGKTATAAGSSRWISSEPSRALVHQIRGQMDAIVAGIGTVELDDPLLTARIPHPPRIAARIVLDSSARLKASSQLAQTAREIPVLVAVTDRASPDRLEILKSLGCEILALGGAGRVPVRALLEELGRRDMTNILVEGGAEVAASFLDAGQVDAIDVFIAPALEGGDHARTPLRGRGHSLMSEAARLVDVEVQAIGTDTRICGRLCQPWCAAIAPLGVDG